MPKTKRTALHVAARFGNAECIPILVRFGANIETEDKDGKTALELAVWKKHCLAAQELKKLGASIKGRRNRRCFEGIEISIAIVDLNCWNALNLLYQSNISFSFFHHLLRT